VHLFGSHQFQSVLDASLYIVNRNIRVIPGYDLGKGDAGLDKFQDAIDRDPGPGDARLSEMHLWVNHNAIFHGMAS
jgi:hypothetical protein